MDNGSPSIPVPDGVQVTSPAPAAPVAQAAPAEAAAPVQQPMPDMSAKDGGSTNSFNDFIKSINWLEAGFAILGAVGLYYTVYYYRYKLKEDRVANSDTQRQIDEIKMNVQSAMKGKYQAL